MNPRNLVCLLAAPAVLFTLACGSDGIAGDYSASEFQSAEYPIERTSNMDGGFHYIAVHLHLNSDRTGELWMYREYLDLDDGVCTQGIDNESDRWDVQFIPLDQNGDALPEDSEDDWTEFLFVVDGLGLSRSCERVADGIDCGEGYFFDTDYRNGETSATLIGGESCE